VVVVQQEQQVLVQAVMVAQETYTQVAQAQRAQEYFLVEAEAEQDTQAMAQTVQPTTAAMVVQAVAVAVVLPH
jgi:hypothetical protein